MATSMAGGTIGLAQTVEPTLAGAGCSIRVVEAPAGLPNGFPEVLAGPMSWTGGLHKDRSEYIHVLSKSDLQEIEDARRQFNCECLIVSPTGTHPYEPGIGRSL